MTADPPLPDPLTIRQAAAEYGAAHGVSEHMITMAVIKKKLPTVLPRTGIRHLIRRADLEAWLSSRKAKPKRSSMRDKYRGE